MNALIEAELRGVAKRVAQRINASPYRNEVDSYVIRSAIYAVFIYDKPELESTLNEVERLTREALKENDMADGKRTNFFKRIFFALLAKFRK